MNQTVLITGGAGFIGSHLTDQLLARGWHVRILDNLHAQVHGSEAQRPSYLDPRAELRVGNVCDPQDVTNALQGAEAVVHLAAAVGVGQSMYQPAHYTTVNNLGSAVLLQALTQHPVKRLVVASSMSVYGKGLYVDKDGRLHSHVERTLEQLQAHEWELHDSRNRPLMPVPTPETKTPSLASVYALSKFDQERMALIIGRAYHIPTVALRFFNVYGPRQALSNPYTGVLAIFASRLLNNQAPLIYEDGLQQRDFVSVHDVACACALALEAPEQRVHGQVFNIASGQPRTILEIAYALARVLDKIHLQPQITGSCRVGDIRHCIADITHAREMLGYEPQITLQEGLTELSQWLATQQATDQVARASQELVTRGLSL